MNERIKELADKASQWVIDNSNGVHAPYERWNEKFAELIVRECIGHINNMAQSYREVNEQDGSEDVATYTLGGIVALKKLANDLKQHFGVK